MPNYKLSSIITILLTAAAFTLPVSADTKNESETQPKNVTATEEPKQEKTETENQSEKTPAEKTPAEKTSAEKTPAEKTPANDFLFRFYRTVRNQNGTENNMATSPYGASCLGEMLMFGAEGETKQSLQDLFVPSGQRSKRAKWFHLSKDNEQVLPLVAANGIWIQKGFPVRAAYTVALQTLFNLKVTEADFTSRASEECTKINEWIAGATNNKITKLFESLDAQSRIVLVNTLNFQGKWAIPFDKSATKTGTFYCAEDKTVEVSLMQNTLRLNYTKNDLYQAVAVPYEKNRCSMIIVLPNETSMLNRIEAALDEDAVTKLINEMILERVEVTLPIFEIESDIDLKSVLKKAGAGIVFDSQKADFSGISNVEGLYVEQMIQKIFLRVDESGTEAVAGTGANIVPKSANFPEVSPLIFRADHPFLFLIRDNTNGVPLFIGRFVAP
jgi:serpin B